MSNRATQEDWSPSTTVFANSKDCSGGTTARATGGIAKDFVVDGRVEGRFTVEIQCLEQLNDPADSTDPCKGVSESAPESVEASKNTFFKITSTGYYPADGSGATRKIEAIYNTEDLDVPKGYFALDSIEVKGTADVKDVSLFSLGDVTVSNDAKITGTDLAYGDWKNSVNPTARKDTAGNSVTAAGIGAVGTISGKVSGRDYDKTTCPKLVQVLAASSTCPTPGRMTFPFKDDTQPDLDFLREEAQRQGTYIVPNNASYTIDTWPSGSSSNTVVFVEFANNGSNNVKWGVSGSCTDNPPKQGMLIVSNGGFTMQPNQALFRGAVIVRGGVAADGESADSGNTCLEGFVNTTGTITLAGRVRPIGSNTATNRPGFYGVRIWSWRELYQ